MASALDQLEGLPVRPLTVPVADSTSVDDTAPATCAAPRKSLSANDTTPLERLPLKWRKFGMSNFKTKVNIGGQHPEEPAVPSAEDDNISPRPVAAASDSAPPRGTSRPVKAGKADTKRGKKGKSGKRPQSTKKTAKTQAEKEEKKEGTLSASTTCLNACALDPPVETTTKSEKSKQAKTPTARHAAVVRLRFQKDGAASSKQPTVTATNGVVGATVEVKEETKTLPTRSSRSKRPREAAIDEDVENKAHLEEMTDDPERQLRKRRTGKQKDPLL